MLGNWKKSSVLLVDLCCLVMVFLDYFQVADNLPQILVSSYRGSYVSSGC